MIAIPFLMGAASAAGAAALGAGAFITMAAFTVGTALGQYLFPTKMNVQNMKPASLSDFSYNQANEGMPVPLIYGTVKMAGNIIWYGNLVTEEQKQHVSGGKGHHSGQDVVTGYKYYVDLWVSLGMGQLQILDTYNNEKKEALQYDSMIFNDGTGSAYPTEPGQYASALFGVSHVFYKKLYVGLNTTTLPTINYVLKQIKTTPISYTSLSNGYNPAAIVYDILVNQINLSSTSIDLASFNAAATTYYNEGLGMNLVITSQKKADELIKYVMQFVNSVCYKDQTTGKYVIKVLE